jgi:predicted negative regulator of RcsB-dependent stress response
MKIFFYTISILAHVAYADYRAYELQIVNNSTQTSRTFKSTLDDLQYKGLYMLQPTEQISIVNTWRCRGNTGSFKPICSN